MINTSKNRLVILSAVILSFIALLLVMTAIFATRVQEAKDQVKINQTKAEATRQSEKSEQDSQNLSREIQDLQNQLSEAEASKQSNDSITDISNTIQTASNEIFTQLYKFDTENFEYEKRQNQIADISSEDISKTLMPDSAKEWNDARVISKLKENPTVYIESQEGSKVKALAIVRTVVNNNENYGSTYVYQLTYDYDQEKLISIDPLGNLLSGIK